MSVPIIIPNSTFDPYTQPASFLLADGKTPIAVSIVDIDFVTNYNTKVAILFASQLGACVVMFCILAVLTSEKNRRKPLFILNLLALFLGFLRALFTVLYSTSAWTEFYAVYTLDFSGVPATAYGTSITATIVTLLMLVVVSMSLMVQAYTVCKVMNRKYAYPITALSLVTVLLSVGFRFAATVTNCISILHADFYAPQYIRIGSQITSTISIWWFSILFTAKLVFTLYNRKRHGWKQWGAVRILAIMGGCTMIIPSIFAILQYVTSNAFPEAGTMTLTLVALFLPLSSLWARMATDKESARLRDSPTSTQKSSNDVASSSTARTLVSKGSTTYQKGNGTTMCATTIDSVIEHAPATSRDSTELDLENIGVRVDRSYSVNESSSR